MSGGATTAFKPFVVESSRHKGLFRVVTGSGKVSREQMETLLENLPISFTLKKDTNEHSDELREPLEVHEEENIVWIFPPAHRVLTCTTLDSWGSTETVSRMHVDNVMHMTYPGRGQIRTCIHFDPTIFGIQGWPRLSPGEEMELDICVYPREKVNEPKLDTPRFGKQGLRKLLELIAGGGHQLSLDQLNQWRELILYAAREMRANYDNPYADKEYPLLGYYMGDWEAIEAAAREGDDQKLIDALEGLRVSIQME